MLITRTLILSLFLSISLAASAQRGFQVRVPCQKTRGIVEARGGKIFGVGDSYKNFYPAPGLDSMLVYMLDRQGRMLWHKSFTGDVNQNYHLVADTARDRYIVLGNLGLGNHYEAQMRTNMLCFNGQGTLLWQNGVTTGTSFLAPSPTICPRTGDIVMGGVEGSILLSDIQLGRERFSVLTRLDGATGLVLWGLTEPKRDNFYNLLAPQTAVLPSGNIIYATQSWVYDGANWNTFFRLTKLSPTGQLIGQPKLLQKNSLSPPYLLGMRYLAGSLYLHFNAIDSASTGDLNETGPALLRLDTLLRPREGRVYTDRRPRKYITPVGRPAFDPVTREVLFGIMASDSGNFNSNKEGYLQLRTNLQPKRCRLYSVGFPFYPSNHRIAYTGAKRFAAVWAFGLDSAQSIVYTDTAGKGCTAMDSLDSFIVSRPFTMQQPVAEAATWQQAAIYNSGTSFQPFTSNQLALQTCAVPTGPRPRQKRLPRDTTFCGYSLALTWPGSPCCRARWSTGAVGASIIVTQSGRYIVQDEGDCAGQAESDTINVTINPIPFGYVSPGYQTTCPGDTAELLSGNRTGVTYRWHAPVGRFLDTTNRFTMFVVPANARPGTVLPVYITINADSVCPATFTAQVTVANLPTGLIATADSIYFFANTRDSVANWTVTPGTFIPGPVPGSIKATFQADSLRRRVQVRLVNVGGCDTILTLLINLPPPVVIPPPPPPPVLNPQVPNLVTLNQDGLNERFNPVDLGPGPYKLRIYNRWGKEIFASDDYTDGFPPDGTTPSGSYFYQLTTPGQVYKGWLQVAK